jgi:transcriptional antiterminator NusG
LADRCDDSALFFIVESMQDTMTTPKTTTPAPKGRWYVIQVHSGFENKVAESIREQALEKGLDGEIFDVVVPVEEAQDVKKGTKVHTERKFFPGYVLINMIMTDPAWHMIMDNKRVVNFLGGGAKSKPVP